MSCWITRRLVSGKIQLDKSPRMPAVPFREAVTRSGHRAYARKAAYGNPWRHRWRIQRRIGKAFYIHCAFAEIRYWPSDQMQTATAATVGRIETAIGARPNTFMSSFVEAVADPRLRRSR